MKLKRLQDIDVQGERVLVRFDLNVPMTKDGRASDTTRIDRVRPTLDYLRAHGARTIIMAHVGRPVGYDATFSTEFLTTACAQSWNCDVQFCADYEGGDLAQKMSLNMINGDVMLLENIRFNEGEERNDMAFARQLAKLGDVYINDAFSVAHRAHVSTCALAELLPCAAGLSMQAELDALTAALLAPARPVMGIIGGSKVSTKLALLENLLNKVDYLVIGGGMANTFLLAQGIDVGASLAEADLIFTAQKILHNAPQHNCTIILPQDVTASLTVDAPVDIFTGPVHDLPAGFKIFDMGPHSAARVSDIMKTCDTVLWNGPVGVFENAPVDAGTVHIARAIAQNFHDRAMMAVAGGGDTLSAVEKAGLKDEDFTYLSTAGGAFLEWLEGKELPGVALLRA